MTKTFRNIIISFCGIFAFLFAGFFFVGCGIDYDKIQLVAEGEQVVEIDVGESIDLTFKIENYQNGFSNKVKVNKISNAGSEVFSSSDPVYLRDNRIKVTVTGVAGGNGKLQLVTLEAGKECTVDISVNQYSKGLSLNNKVLYVSNDTAFEPNANMFDFDSNTTNKDITYFYIESENTIDFDTYYLKEVDLTGSTLKATFAGENISEEVDIFAFDKIELREVEETKVQELYLIKNGVESKIETPLEDTFRFFAVYNASMNEDGSVNETQYESLLHVVSEVYVLPSLNVQVKGGYVSKEDGYVHGSDITDGDMDFDAFTDDEIKIVPNNLDMNKFILKIQMDNYLSGLPVELLKIQENNHVDVDFCEYTEFGEVEPDTTDGVYYFKITQNVQTQAETDLEFRIFYNIAQGVEDVSVNIKLNFTIKVEIAPIGILVNGTSEPEKTVMYNIYNFPEFGWNELNFDVVSGLESSPNFEGLYFTFDSGYLEMIQDGVSVESDPDNASGKVYTDLNKPFYIRGAYKCSTIEDIKLTAHLKSDILNDSRELTLEIPFEIVQGAETLTIDTAYQAYNKNFYLDFDAGTQKFDNVLYSNAIFQDVIYKHEGGTDVVEIDCDDSEPCLDGYYLNLSITPKATGVGKYKLYLDNGVLVELTFNVIKTLTTDKNAFVLSNSGNEMVTNFIYSRSEDAEYDNQLSIDILNSTVNGEVQFGSVANLDVVANLGEEGVKFTVVNGSISRSQSGITQKFATVENGNVEVSAELSGYTVENFSRIAKKTYYTLYFASYSLIQEFNLRDASGNLALSNKVYYGANTKETDKTVAFVPYVDNTNAYGFYKYNFTEMAFVNAFANGARVDGVAEEIYKYSVKDEEIEFDYCYEFYDKKFVYLNLKYLKNETGGKIDIGGGTITAQVKKGGVTKNIQLTISSGLMFFAEDCVFEYEGEKYQVSFADMKYETIIGDFDLDALSYRNKFTSGYTLECSAFIRQRNLTKHYDIEIDAIEFQSVESISLASSVTKLDFSNDMLTYNLGVYTYPQTSTNKSIVVEFVRSESNPYNILLPFVDESEKENGIYTVKLSCEEFFNNRTLRGGKEIVDIEESLTGKVYIFPSEWGSSHSMISSDLQPIVIDVQYRNGSKNNPYLLETAQDFSIINTNSATLNSHYEVNAVIDMSSVSSFTPLGVIDGKVEGFGGSIIGSNAQASIQNIFVTNSNFAYTTALNKTYAGLFAQINDGAVIENIAFSSKFDLNLTNNAYVGAIAGVNRGLISNVGVTVNTSNIKVENASLYYGAVAGINAGKIIQNIDKYDTEEKGYEYLYKLQADGTKEDILDANGKKILADENNNVLPAIRNMKGQQPKTLVYFNDFTTIDVDGATIYAGGIAGASSGTIERVVSDENTLKMYGYTDYSAYALIQLIGETSADVHVGGAVGIASYNTNTAGIASKIIPESDLFLASGKYKYKNLIGNLLVGGEVSTLSLVETGMDHVGGIVGYVNTLGTATIGVYGNISRTYLRGQNYVAGIVGYDYWIEKYGDFNISKYYLKNDKDNQDPEATELARFVEVENSIEAVDDRKNFFYSSMIIKTKAISNYQKNRIYGLYAVGNTMESTSTRYYTSNTGEILTTYFDVKSFSERDKSQFADSNGDFVIDAETIVYDTSSVTDTTYGDYIVAQKEDRQFRLTNQFFFGREKVDIGLDETYADYRMEGNEAYDVFFMYYFSVEGYLNHDGAFAQEEIEELNTISTNSSLYPFALIGDDVTIASANTEILTIDLYGNITLKSQGLAVINVTNIKNVNKNRRIYVYVINYFDKNVESSIYYTSKSMNGQNITNNSSSVVYGSSNTNIYLVPSYGFECDDYENEVKISRAGVLRYKNVDYVLNKNAQITTSVEPDEADREDYFSTIQVNKQTIMFYKSSTPSADDVDEYVLTPVLQISFDVVELVDGVEKVVPYTYIYEILPSKINLNVEYLETATDMYTDSDFVSMKTNGYVKDKVTVVSENENEKIYYQIFYKDKDNNSILIQDRLPSEIGQVADSDWLNYVNFGDGYDDNSNKYKFFDLTIANNVDNTFEFGCEVNVNSDRFLNRFEEDIYGEYTIHFYASDLGLAGGVSCSFKIKLEEAEVVNIAINNYSNINDVAVADYKLVPSQNGLLEIMIDPTEAVFEDITISNSEENYQSGATQASLTFVYERNVLGAVEYVLDPNFGVYKDGTLKFSYDEMQARIAEINEVFGEDSVNYTGKVYVAYFMPSKNVEDAREVGFDVKVNYGNNLSMPASVDLTTKLGSYVKLSFDNKEDFGGVYYVARGLEYDLTLESYGFSESQITISTNSSYAQVVKENGKYKLKITDETISYNNDIGFSVEITTRASRKVDTVEITSESTMMIYIMEYVVDYTYIEGVNEDIVKGMEDGIINTAVGNPYVLEFDIRKFLEYNEGDGDVQAEVDAFVASMTQNINWSVYYNGEPTALASGKEFKTQHYKINGLTVVPLMVYSADSDIYYFSAEAKYSMYQGRYRYNAVGAYQLYTEFEFDVHNQSTEDSPIPIYTYEEFMAMEDGEWYILLNDIAIPNTALAGATKAQAFAPIGSSIKGLDGNNRKIYLSGTYDFSGLSNIGIFEQIATDSIIQNVTIQLSGDTEFKVNESTFNVGLLAAKNNGIVTNCEVTSVNNSAFSVVYSAQDEDKKTTNSYVAGLVARNSGYVTHSRSKVNIYCNFNLAGLVAVNEQNAVITSSYFMGGSLKNQTNDNAVYTAGLVVSNNGDIYTSYVSGTPSASVSYYNGSDNFILSSNNISGFVYTNNGQIYDSYSNIQLKYSGAYASGFVFENAGHIERCISTSVLESEQSKNYGFARVNNLIDSESDAGTIVNCYYLKDKVGDLDINQSITQIENDELTDIQALTLAQFADYENFETYFSDFVYANGRNINSVWFFNSKANDTSNFNGQIFNTNRLELVAPNIIASSDRVLEGIQSVVEGDYTYTKYIYTYKVGSQALGSMYNPILISDAEKMEEYVLQENNRSGYNYSHYRIIADIDYEDYLYNSKLYTTKFVGYIEGNFMDIDNISFVTSEAMTTAGMFAEIGKTGLLNAIGTVMNLTIRPTAVSFANTQVVGALAGKVDGGNVFNINIELKNQDQLVAVGQNIVGGGIGLAVGNYKIQNLYTQLSAKARNQEVSSLDASLEPNTFVKEWTDYSKYSFAGSVVGVLSGSGRFINGKIDTTVSVLADKAGLMFGLIDESVVVEKLAITIDEDMLVNAYSYGGLIVGESKGVVSNVEINGNNMYFTNFKKIPTVSIAVGGYAGLMSGGRLENVKMTQSIQISDTSASTGIEYLGGVVGIITTNVKMSNIIVDADLIGFKYVGGVAGNISSSGRVQFENIVVDSYLAVFGLKVTDIGIGGLAGDTDTNSTIALTTSYSEELASDASEVVINEKKQKLLEEFGYEQNIFNIIVATNMSVYNEEVKLYVGPIVGSNRSITPHAISDAVLTIQGDNIVNDFGGAYASVLVKLIKNVSDGRATISVIANEEEDKSKIGYNTFSATRTTFDAQLDFTSMKNTGKSYILTVNFFGALSVKDLLIQD